MMICKNRVLIKEMKMSEVIFQNHLLILVLERLEMNLGFGDKTIEEVFEKTPIKLNVFLTISNLFNNSISENCFDFSCDEIKEIISYLKISHKYYIEEKYPSILNSIKLLISSSKASEIKMVENFFNEYIKEVEEHIEYENKIVFPYILNLFTKKNDSNYNQQNNGYSVLEYKHHHNDIESKLLDLRNLLILHLPSENDIVSRRKILLELFSLQHDLSIHEKIEDVILIPLVEKKESIIKSL